MTRRSDAAIKAGWEADQLLRELGVGQLPIDPFEIASQLDIDLRPLSGSPDGASGMLIHVNGQFGIGYPTHIRSEGFKNFSVGHELGHYRLPGHIGAVLKGRGRHYSRAGFRSVDPFELEADYFSAALLMPTKPFTNAARLAGDGLNAIEVLSRRCKTSLEATAIRYAQTSRDPVCILRSSGNKIDYAFMSAPLKEFSGLKWIRKGALLPTGSVTAAFNTDESNVERRARIEGSSWLQGWFSGPYRQEVLEEVMGLGSYGKTLTLLHGIETPEGAEDDDEKLQESWTPRFRQ